MVAVHKLDNKEKESQRKTELVMVADDFNPSTLEAEARGSVSVGLQPAQSTQKNPVSKFKKRETRLDTGPIREECILFF